MKPIDAFHLPGVHEADVRDWHVRETDGIQLRFPVLEPSDLDALLRRIRRARDEHLANRPVAEIVEAIDAVAGRLTAGPMNETIRRALPAVSGFSGRMAGSILENLLPIWRRPALDALLRSEFGDPEFIDRFRPRFGPPGPLARAFGPTLAFHVFAGNVPGVSVTSLVRSLLVKSATLGKTASGEPLLAPLFARTLAEIQPALGECIAVTYWPGGTRELEDVAIQAAELVVVYGGLDAVASIRERLPPGTRLAAHGPGVSAGLIGTLALHDPDLKATVRDAALAVALFDQQGCVSPHLFFVEEDGPVSVPEFAERLASELEALQTALPRGTITAAEAAAIHQERAAAEFRAGAERDVRVMAGESAGFTVVYDSDPGFSASPLNRFVWVKPATSLETAVDRLHAVAPFLNTVGIAGAEDRMESLASRLGEIGASRIAPLRQMPWPHPGGHHDGRGPLMELVRWVVLE